MLIPLAFLCCLGCQQGERVVSLNLAAKRRIAGNRPPSISVDRYRDTWKYARRVRLRWMLTALLTVRAGSWMLPNNKSVKIKATIVIFSRVIRCILWVRFGLCLFY
jgi:hypothetical protein